MNLKVVEVFKTNLNNAGDARAIIDQIEALFPEAKANFDLDDCDKILRVEVSEDAIDSKNIMNVVRNTGYKIEVLQ